VVRCRERLGGLLKYYESYLPDPESAAANLVLARVSGSLVFNHGGVVTEWPMLVHSVMGFDWVAVESQLLRGVLLLAGE
jgi:hypothetical protein